MGFEVWYRGESLDIAPSKPGGAIHDLGDGMYFSSDREVAKLYAETRAQDNPNNARAYEVMIDMSQMRILDLTKDHEWNNFLRSRPMPQFTVEELIRMANENYGRFFETFLRQKKIDIRQYDAVIGTEFIRGGRQLCILLKDGQQTARHIKIRGDFKLFYKKITNTNVPQVAGFELVPFTAQQIMVTQSTARNIARQQAFIGALGILMEEGLLWLNDKFIISKVQHELENCHLDEIRTILARGQGVLVIIRLKEWKYPDANGFRMKAFLSVHVFGGSTLQAAKAAWQNMSIILPGAPEGWRSIENYAWIPPCNQR